MDGERSRITSMEQQNHFLILQRSLSSNGYWKDVYLDSWKKMMEVDSNQGENGVLALINSLLVSNEKHEIGLKLLDLYVERATINNIEQGIHHWMKLLVKGSSTSITTSTSASVQYPFLSYRILGKIAIRCRESPRLERIFIVNYLPKIYASFGTGATKPLSCVLSCCEICLKYYPQDSAPYKQTIEQMLRQHIDSLNEDVSYLVGKCFHLLQCVRDKTGKNPKEQWSNYVQQLLNNMHIVLNRLYAKHADSFNPLTGHDSNSESSMLLNEDKLGDDLIEKFAQLYIQLRNLTIYLMVAIRDPFPVKKSLRIQRILNLIVRGFSVNNIMLLEYPHSESLILESIVPKVHIDLMQLLNVLIMIANFNMRAYNSIIVRLLANTLKWTTELKCKDPQQMIGCLRSKTYEMISVWCNIMKTGSRIEVVIKDLLQEIFTDLNVTQQYLAPKQTNKLTIQDKSKSEKKQKYQFKLHQTDNLNGKSNGKTMENSLKWEHNDNICQPTIVLNSLHSILQSAFIFLDSMSIKMLYINILSLSTQLLHSNAIKQPNRETYASVYNILYFLYSTPNLYAAQFKTLLCKTLNVISLHCRNGQLQNLPPIHAIESIIHPIKDGLLYPHKATDLSEVFNKPITTTMELNSSNESCDDDMNNDINDVDMNNDINNADKLKDTNDDDMNNDINDADMLKDANDVDILKDANDDDMQKDTNNHADVTDQLINNKTSETKTSTEVLTNNVDYMEDIDCNRVDHRKELIAEVRKDVQGVENNDEKRSLPMDDELLRTEELSSSSKCDTQETTPLTSKNVTSKDKQTFKDMLEDITKDFVYELID